MFEQPHIIEIFFFSHYLLPKKLLSYEDTQPFRSESEVTICEDDVLNFLCIEYELVMNGCLNSLMKEISEKILTVAVLIIFETRKSDDE